MNEVVDKAIEGIENSQKIVLESTASVPQRENFIEAATNLQESYQQLMDGTNEESDYAAAAWDIAQAEKLLLQDKEDNVEEAYNRLLNISEGAKDELCESSIDGADKVTDYLEDLSPKKDLEMTYEDLQEAAERELD
ncbi:MAG: hypothetical protein ACI9LV_000696 [Candidatus Nanohaloarchaea archaeon]|jgi:hypothetical protein